MQSSYSAFLFCHIRNRSHPKSINPESVNLESVSSAVRLYSYTFTIHIYPPGVFSFRKMGFDQAVRPLWSTTSTLT